MFNRLLLIFAVALLITTESCKEKTTLGLDNIPEVDGINVFQSDTFQLAAYNIKFDSVKTNVTSNVFLGSCIMPNIGEVNQNFVMQFSLQQSNFVISNGSITVDSIFLNVPYIRMYQDSTNTSDLQTVSVFRLNDVPNKDSAYYSSYVLNYNPTPLNYSSSPYDFTKIKDSILIDSVKATPSLHIRLKNEFADSIVAQQGKTAFANSTEFANWMRGLAVVATGQGSKKSLLMLTRNSANIMIHYRDSANVKKIATFFYSSNYNASFSTSKTLFNANIANLMANPDSINGEEKLYINNKPGILAQVKIPKIMSLKDYVINEAVLQITEDKPLHKYNTIEQLFLRKFYSKDSVVPTLDFLGMLSTASGDLSSKFTDGHRLDMGTYYQFNIRITKELSEAIKNSEDLILNLSAFDATGVNGISFYDTELNGSRNSVPQNKRMKLKITYSKF